jgi:hypothetical protein
MSTGLDDILGRMADYLTAQGVEAVAAWPGQARLERTRPVVVVSLRGCQAGAAGFQDYLGERYNETTGLWEELYGRRATLTFGLDLYAPAEGTEDGMQRAFHDLAQALTKGGPEGLTVQEFSCGETAYDSGGRLLKRTAQAVCLAYLYAVAEPGGVFLDFELRGGVKQ